jgi:hypothetical protein
MGQTNSSTERQREVNMQRLSNWIQFALLLLAMLAMALHGEGRLSRIEQRMDDSDKERTAMQEQLNRVEQILLTRTP